MKHFLKLIALTTLLLSQAVNAADKPNIILILLDDLGWRDVGFMGNTFIETPALDKLASDGLVFNNAYSNAPNCAPSRAAIMSGQYAPRTGVYTMIKGDMGDERLRRVITPENKMYLEPATITLAEMLKTAGYRTAQIGKWNLGSGQVRGPLGQGFDINIAGERNGTAHKGYFAPYDLPGLDQAPKGEYLTDRLTEEAIKFINQQTSDKKGRQPFFIYLSHFAPHFPLQAPQALVKKYQRKKNLIGSAAEPLDETYAAMISSVDNGVGKIIDALKTQGLDQNTLIIFTSDNGGYDTLSYMDPLRGQKSLLYEGGIRVPTFVWWPGHVTPGKTDVPIAGIDFFPTLMAAAGVANIDQNLDGVDLSPLFRNATATLKRDTLYWYFPAYVAGGYEKAADEIFQQRPAAVIQKNRWKLIQYLDSNNVELYNLDTDPSEKNNVAERNLEKRQELTQQLQHWLDNMNADGRAGKPLVANPNYSKNYEQDYQNSWLRKLRLKLSHTRFGIYFQEKDL